MNAFAAKTNQGNASIELLSQQSDRLEHVTERVARLESTQPIDVSGRSNRILNRWPLALDEIEVEPHRGEGQEEIREEDRGVHVDRVDGL
jgi:hypothetical protein